MFTICLSHTDPSLVPRNTFLQKPNSIEFIKTPIVEQKTCQSVINNVNKTVQEQNEGRLFAVIQVMGKQYKVTAGDIIVLEGYWAPTIGDKLRMEKVCQIETIFISKSWFSYDSLLLQVLLVGGDKFTVTGRPLIQRNLVDVQATVIEKTLAHTRTNFRKKPRKNYKRIKFHRSIQSMIRINSITLNPQIDMNAKQRELIE